MTERTEVEKVTRKAWFERVRLFKAIPKKLENALEVDQRPGRLMQMEGMRGYAVLLVFLVHHHNLFNSFLPASSALLSISLFGNGIGHSGVDIFFVLSGFLIYGSLLQRPTGYISFCGRRVRRIYPTFLVVLGIYVMLCHLIPSTSKLPPTTSGEALFIAQNVLLLPGMLDLPGLVTVAWSLSYEFFFYLSIPLVILLTGMRRWRSTTRILFFSGLVLAHLTGYALNIVPHVRLAMFIAGVLLYEVVAGGKMKDRLSRGGELLVIALYCGTLFALGWVRLGNTGGVQTGVPGYPSIVLIGLLWLALFGLAAYCIVFNGILKRMAVFRPLRLLGNMSYSYFLLHGLVLNGVAFLMGRLVGPEYKSVPLFFALLAINLLLTLFASLILFLLIEKPFSLSVKPSKIGGAARQASEAVGAASGSSG